MRMRPKKSAKDLPPKMLRRKKTLASGKVWVGYYYNGRDGDGKRKEIPLGTDLAEAKRKWAELEGRLVDSPTQIMAHVFDRYEREIIPMKAPKTQKDNLTCLRRLRKSFDTAPIDALTPQQIAKYRDARTAKVAANRELSILSSVFNFAREWGYTTKENPLRGLRRNKETPRDYYVEKDVWDAVYACACEELKDAMDLAYLTGQRPGDVRKLMMSDIQDNALFVAQNKTGKKLRIMLYDMEGNQTELARVIDRIRARPRQVKSMFLLSTRAGQPLSHNMITFRFNAARAAAAKKSERTLAEKIMKFQFRDIRALASTDISDLEKASKLLGHTRQEMTKRVYRRKPEKVMPTR